MVFVLGSCSHQSPFRSWERGPGRGVLQLQPRPVSSRPSRRRSDTATAAAGSAFSSRKPQRQGRSAQPSARQRWRRPRIGVTEGPLGITHAHRQPTRQSGSSRSRRQPKRPSSARQIGGDLAAKTRYVVRSGGAGRGFGSFPCTSPRIPRFGSGAAAAAAALCAHERSTPKPSIRSERGGRGQARPPPLLIAPGARSGPHPSQRTPTRGEAEAGARNSRCWRLRPKPTHHPLGPTIALGTH